MKLIFSRQIFEKYSNIEFHESSSCGSQGVPCKTKEGQTGGQTSMTKLIVAIWNFVNTSELHYT